MTAAIVTHHSRNPLRTDAAKILATNPASRSALVPGPVPGQLWERVAERQTPDPSRITPRLSYGSAIVGETAGERRSESDPYGRGPAVCVAPRFTVGRHMCPVPQSHGILRPDVIR